MSINKIKENEIFMLNLEDELQHESGKMTSFVVNDIAKDIRFIPLQTSDSILLYNTLILSKIRDKFIVSSGFFNETGIFEFSVDGKFQRELIKKGEGPNEVSLPLFWSVNDSLKLVSVLDYIKIVNYSFEQDCASQVLLGKHVVRSILLNDGNYACTYNTYGQNDREIPYLAIHGQKGHVIQELHYSQDRNIEIVLKEGRGGNYESYDMGSNYLGEALFKDVFNDTIYKIKELNNMTPYLCIYRGKLTPLHEDSFNEEKKMKTIYVRSVQETEEYFILSFLFQDKACTSIWDKESSKLVGGTEVDRSSLEAWYKHRIRYRTPAEKIIDIPIVHVDRNILYCVLLAEDAMEFIPNLAVDSNPVVMELTLK